MTTKHIQVKISIIKNKCFIEDENVFEFPEEDRELIIEMMKYMKEEKEVVK